MKISVAALLASTSVLCGSPHAQNTVPPAAVQQAEADDDVVVTVSRVGERTVTTSPMPIHVLRGDELRTSGYQETSEVLRQLAPSFSFQSDDAGRQYPHPLRLAARRQIICAGHVRHPAQDLRSPCGSSISI